MVVNQRTPAIMLILALVCSLCVSAFSVSAQDPEVPLGYEMGIDDEEVNNQTFMLSSSGMATISFWVDNSYASSIELEVQYLIPFDGQVDGPETVQVSSGSNETFDFTVKGIDVAEFDAGSKDAVEVETRLIAIGPVPTGDAGSPQTDDTRVEIPVVVELTVSLSEPGGPMNAGTTTELTVTVSNAGNAIDSVYKATLSDTCPLLDVDWKDEVEGVSIARSATISGTLIVNSSKSHPTKTCIIEIAIQSTGDVNNGKTVNADDAEVSLKVVSEPVGGSGGNSGSSGGSSSSSEGSGDIVSSNWAPLPIWLPLIAIFGALYFAKRE